MMEPSERLVQDLMRGLAPVSAPPELWGRVEARLDRKQPAARPRSWGFAVAAAAVAVVVAVVVLFGQRPAPMVAGLTALHQELSAHPDTLGVLDGDAGQLRRWLGGHGFTLTPAMSGEHGVMLIGAGILRQEGQDYAAVHYRVQGAPVTLFIRPSADQTRRPKAVLQTAGTGMTTYRWHNHGQDFVLVVSATHDARRACALCHGETAG